MSLRTDLKKAETAEKRRESQEPTGPYENPHTGVQKERTLQNRKYI